MADYTNFFETLKDAISHFSRYIKEIFNIFNEFITIIFQNSSINYAVIIIISTLIIITCIKIWRE